ncbi:MAG: hypothetical protein RL417_65 [Pseudomonadota bacterium]
MERADRELIERVLTGNFELRKLYEEHCKLEEILSSFENRPFLTSAEEIEEKRLKMRKLQGVDRMMSIVADHRCSAP